MAGLNPAQIATGLSRQHYSTIAWLRWRIFMNSMRRKGATAELAVRILSYPVLALMILGPSTGAGFFGFYLVRKGLDAYLAAPLWIIFALWQFVGINTSTTAPPFDLSTLIRFPIRYRDYFVIRLSFGLLDAPTLIGSGCLIALCIGIGIAAPSLLPWAIPATFIYAVCNILFSRMLYLWLERWLAQRRTRELITGIILLGSLAFQFATQFANRFTVSKHHAPLSPLMVQAESALLMVNHVLPPGLTSTAIEYAHRGSFGIAVAAQGGLLAYALGFLLVLHLRFNAQYHGESLSDSPVAAKVRDKSRRASSNATNSSNSSHSSSSSSLLAMLPSAVAANLVKELRYLLRSGPKLYVLVMPVFIVVLFSVRSSGMSYMGAGRGAFSTFLFSYGCSYTQLLLVGMLYNSLGSDSTGVQFYFIAPTRMRDVLLAKNLLTGAILTLEMVLVYFAATFLSARPALSVVAATVAWTIFTFFLNASIGNVRSITSPKGMDPSKVRSQNLSGVSGFISLVVTLGSAGLGYLMIFVCNYLQTSYWMAAGVFLLLSGVSFGIYLVILRQLDGIAAEHTEDLIRDLCKV